VRTLGLGQISSLLEALARLEQIDRQIGPAKIIGTRKLFDIETLDQFFDALPEEINQGTEDWQVAL